MSKESQPSTSGHGAFANIPQTPGGTVDVNNELDFDWNPSLALQLTPRHSQARRSSITTTPSRPMNSIRQPPATPSDLRSPTVQNRIVELQRDIERIKDAELDLAQQESALVRARIEQLAADLSAANNDKLSLESAVHELNSALSEAERANSDLYQRLSRADASPSDIERQYRLEMDARERIYQEALARAEERALEERGLRQALERDQQQQQQQQQQQRRGAHTDLRAELEQEMPLAASGTAFAERERQVRVREEQLQREWAEAQRTLDSQFQFIEEQRKELQRQSAINSASRGASQDSGALRLPAAGHTTVLGSSGSPAGTPSDSDTGLSAADATATVRSQASLIEQLVARNDALEQQTASLQAHAARVEDDARHARETHAEHVSDLQRLNALNGQLNESLASVQAQCSALEARISSAEAETEAATAEAAEWRRTATALQAEVSSLRVRLDEATARAEDRQRDRDLQQQQHQQQQQDQTVLRQASRIEELSREVSLVTHERERLAAAQTQHERVLADYRADMQAKDQAVAQLQQDRHALQARVDALQTKLLAADSSADGRSTALAAQHEVLKLESNSLRQRLAEADQAAHEAGAKLTARTAAHAAELADCEARARQALQEQRDLLSSSWQLERGDLKAQLEKAVAVLRERDEAVAALAESQQQLRDTKTRLAASEADAETCRRNADAVTASLAILREDAARTAQDAAHARHELASVSEERAGLQSRLAGVEEQLAAAQESLTQVRVLRKRLQESQDELRASQNEVSVLKSRADLPDASAQPQSSQYVQTLEAQWRELHNKVKLELSAVLNENRRLQGLCHENLERYEAVVGRNQELEGEAKAGREEMMRLIATHNSDYNAVLLANNKLEHEKTALEYEAAKLKDMVAHRDERFATLQHDHDALRTQARAAEAALDAHRSGADKASVELAQATAQRVAASERLAHLEAEVDTLRARAQASRDEVDEWRGKANALDQQLISKDLHVAKADHALATSEQAVASFTSQLNRAEAALAAEKAKLAAAEAAHSQALAAARTEAEDRLAALQSQASAAEAAARAQHEQRLDEVKAAASAELSAAAAAHETQLQALRDSFAQRAADVEAAHAKEVDRLLASARAAAETHEEQLAHARADCEDRLAAVEAELQEELRTIRADYSAMQRQAEEDWGSRAEQHQADHDAAVAQARAEADKTLQEAQAQHAAAAAELSARVEALQAQAQAADARVAEHLDSVRQREQDVLKLTQALAAAQTKHQEHLSATTDMRHRYEAELVDERQRYERAHAAEQSLSRRLDDSEAELARARSLAAKQRDEDREAADREQQLLRARADTLMKQLEHVVRSQQQASSECACKDCCCVVFVAEHVVGDEDDDISQVNVTVQRCGADKCATKHSKFVSSLEAALGRLQDASNRHVRLLRDHKATAASCSALQTELHVGREKHAQIVLELEQERGRRAAAVQEVSERVAEWEARCDEQMRSLDAAERDKLELNDELILARGRCEDVYRDYVHACSERDEQHAAAVQLDARCKASARALAEQEELAAELESQLQATRATADAHDERWRSERVELVRKWEEQVNKHVALSIELGQARAAAEAAKLDAAGTRERVAAEVAVLKAANTQLTDSLAAAREQVQTLTAQQASAASHSHTELSNSLAAARARVSELEGLCDRHRQEVHAREASLRDAEHASALRMRELELKHESELLAMRHAVSSDSTSHQTQLAAANRALEAAQAAAAKEADALTQRVSQLQQQLDAELASKNSTQQELSSTSRAHDDLRSQLQQLQQQHDAQARRLAEVEAAHGSASTEVDTLTAELDHERALRSQLDAQCTATTREYEHVSSSFREIKELYGQLQSRYSEYTGEMEASVSSLRGTTAQQDGELAKLTADLADATQTVSVLRDEAEVARVEAEGLRAELSAGADRISALDAEVADHTARVSTLETELSASQSRVATLEDHLDAATGMLGDKEQELMQRLQEAAQRYDDVCAAKDAALQEHIAQAEAAAAHKADEHSRELSRRDEEHTAAMQDLSSEWTRALRERDDLIAERARELSACEADRDRQVALLTQEKEDLSRRSEREREELQERHQLDLERALARADYDHRDKVREVEDFYTQKLHAAELEINSSEHRLQAALSQHEELSGRHTTLVDDHARLAATADELKAALAQAHKAKEDLDKDLHESRQALAAAAAQHDREQQQHAQAAAALTSDAEKHRKSAQRLQLELEGRTMEVQSLSMRIRQAELSTGDEISNLARNRANDAEARALNLEFQLRHREAELGDSARARRELEARLRECQDKVSALQFLPNEVNRLKHVEGNMQAMEVRVRQLEDEKSRLLSEYRVYKNENLRLCGIVDESDRVTKTLRDDVAALDRQLKQERESMLATLQQHKQQQALEQQKLSHQQHEHVQALERRLSEQKALVMEQEHEASALKASLESAMKKLNSADVRGKEELQHKLLLVEDLNRKREEEVSLLQHKLNLLGNENHKLGSQARELQLQVEALQDVTTHPVLRQKIAAVLAECAEWKSKYAGAHKQLASVAQRLDAYNSDNTEAAGVITKLKLALQECSKRLEMCLCEEQRHRDALVAARAEIAELHQREAAHSVLRVEKDKLAAMLEVTRGVVGDKDSALAELRREVEQRDASMRVVRKERDVAVVNKDRYVAVMKALEARHTQEMEALRGELDASVASQNKYYSRLVVLTEELNTLQPKHLAAVKRMDDLKADADARVEGLQARMAAAEEEWRGRYERDLQEQAESFDECVRGHQQALEQSRARVADLEARLEAQQRDAAARAQAAARDHAEAVSALKAAHGAAAEKLVCEHGAALSSLQLDHETALDQLREEKAADRRAHDAHVRELVLSLKREYHAILAKAEQDHKEALAAAQAAHDALMAKAEAHHAAEVAALAARADSERQALVDAHARALREAADSKDADAEALRRAHEQDAAHAAEESARALDRAEAAHQAVVEQLRAAHAEDTQDLQEQHAADRDALTAALSEAQAVQGDLQQALEAAEAEAGELERDLDSLRAEYDALRADAREAAQGLEHALDARDAEKAETTAAIQAHAETLLAALSRNRATPAAPSAAGVCLCGLCGPAENPDADADADADSGSAPRPHAGLPRLPINKAFAPIVRALRDANVPRADAPALAAVGMGCSAPLATHTAALRQARATMCSAFAATDASLRAEQQALLAAAQRGLNLDPEGAGFAAVLPSQVSLGSVSRSLMAALGATWSELYALRLRFLERDPNSQTAAELGRVCTVGEAATQQLEAIWTAVSGSRQSMLRGLSSSKHCAEAMFKLLHAVAFVHQHAHRTHATWYAHFRTAILAKQLDNAACRRLLLRFPVPISPPVVLSLDADADAPQDKPEEPADGPVSASSQWSACASRAATTLPSSSNAFPQSQQASFMQATPDTSVEADPADDWRVRQLSLDNAQLLRQRDELLRQLQRTTEADE